LIEIINYAIGGINTLLPQNKDVITIKETLEQALQKSGEK